MSLVLSRLRGASTGGTPTGVHGTNIVGTKALPSGQALSTSGENTVTGLDRPDVRRHRPRRRRLAGGRHQGDADDPEAGGARSSARQTIDVINPGQDKVGHLLRPRRRARSPSKTTLSVDVAPVPGEQDTANNKASLPGHLLARLMHVSATGAADRRARGGSASARSGSGSPGGRRSRSAASATRSGCCSAAGARISSTSPSRCRARIDDLHRAVDEVAAGLARVDRRVDGTVANTSIVRYDAYEDTGGHQSASLALLDSAPHGLVVTAIQGRDYARIYMKELERGARVGRPLAGGAGSGRPRDGPVSSRR